MGERMGMGVFLCEVGSQFWLWAKMGDAKFGKEDVVYFLGLISSCERVMYAGLLK